MRIIILAFIISISLHFFLFNSYKDEKLHENKEEKKLIEKKSDIKFVKLEPKKIIQEKEVEIKTKEVEKPLEKKIVENKNIQKKNINKKTTDINIEKARKFQENVLKEQIVNKENSIQEKTLENFLSQKEPINKEILNELEKLYGEEYDTFTKIQKAYLEKNLNNFQVITQRVLNRLGYPKLAAKLKIGGVNIVEFIFHPDGSITGLKITNSSGYAVLDDYSLELIEIAYKDYPRPTTATKLKFYVRYSLY